MSYDLRAARAALSAKIKALVGEGEIPRLEEALTHPSYSNESRRPDNQRLEFLGDSVLGLVVTHYVFEHYPLLPEGQLSEVRAGVVKSTIDYRQAYTLRFVNKAVGLDLRPKN